MHEISSIAVNDPNQSGQLSSLYDMLHHPKATILNHFRLRAYRSTALDESNLTSF
ncbi:MAG: hypothetical protein IPP42_06910 [Saprospiraceae bacterium]|nr:hypothetical protein [Saprospiraceae bacterium]